MIRKNNLPKISIVMPCFNTVDYIERSIRSVVEQDYKKIELIIKDGGSKDGTIDIIKYYEKKYPNLVTWISGKDEGQADAINYAMKRATGEVFGYLNGDDVLKEGALRKVAEYFAKNSSSMWVYGKANIIDSDDREMRRWITTYKNFWLGTYSYNTLLILNYISQMACFWRKKAADSVGEFDKNQHYVMDYDYWLRLGNKFKPGIIHEYLASFRIVPTAKGSTGFIKQFQDEFEVAKKYTNNLLIIILHQLHMYIIILIYSFLKFVHSFSYIDLNQQGND